MSTMLQSPLRGPVAPAAKQPPTTVAELAIRLGLTAIVVGLYVVNPFFVSWLHKLLNLSPGNVAVEVVTITILFGMLIAVWWPYVRNDPRLHAPLFITYILLISDASFAILLNQSSPLLDRLSGGLITGYCPTYVAIFAAIVLEIVLSKFLTGKWPHLASAYISGISAGILVKSHDLWPFVLTAWLSITSKYVLRWRGRHLWNPTNFGVSVMVFFAVGHLPFLGGGHMHVLADEAGNSLWSVAVIWILGSFILYRFKLIHIPLVFVATFIPLALLRALLPGGGTWQSELAPMTFTMFQLFIFFMITDPKTITKRRWSQCLVVILVAIVDMLLRLLRDQYSLFDALFIVGPISNAIEIYATRAQSKLADIAPVGMPNAVVVHAEQVAHVVL